MATDAEKLKEALRIRKEQLDKRVAASHQRVKDIEKAIADRKAGKGK